MKYKALVGFSGIVSMAKGEVKELTDEKVINDLLNANYIEEVKKRGRPSKEVAKNE